MPYTFQVTFDSATPHALADWWAEALGWQVEPSDEDVIRRLVSQGYATEDDTTTHSGALVWKAGAAINAPADSQGAPRVLFQYVAEPKTVKNRVHLDLRVGDDELDTVVERYRSAGATVLHRGQLGPANWVTLTDPEGNEFCVSG